MEIFQELSTVARCQLLIKTENWWEGQRERGGAVPLLPPFTPLNDIELSYLILVNTKTFSLNIALQVVVSHCNAKLDISLKLYKKSLY